MENYEEFEQLLRQYSFKELSAEDKQVAQRFVHSEDEYESLRHAGQQLDAHFSNSAVSPRPQIWRRIKKTWHESNAHNNHWVQTPVPAYATFLLLTGVGLLSWMGGSRYTSNHQIAVRPVKTLVDTVFIASTPDTVVRERVIYRERESRNIPALQATTKSLQDHPVVKGVTMKEKEELEKLLVSGSK